MRAISAQLPQLRKSGPVFEVVITPSITTIKTLQLTKKDIPSIKVKALVDTGAHTTAISREVIDKIQLVPRGSARVYTSHSHKTVHEYDIALEIARGMKIGVLRVWGAELQDHSIDCLIGRDVLQYGQFVYDGIAKKFKLTFPADRV